MKTPHVHAELIKAWADGAEIEWLDQHADTWRLATVPGWDKFVTYRIKPEPRPDFVKFTAAGMEGFYDHLPVKANLKLTFDGETGKLKDAEVLK